MKGVAGFDGQNDRSLTVDDLDSPTRLSVSFWKNTLHHLPSVCKAQQQHGYFCFPSHHRDISEFKTQCIFFKQTIKPIHATANHTHLSLCGENNQQDEVILMKEFTSSRYDCYQKVIYRPRFTGKCTNETAFEKKRSALLRLSKTQ